MDEQRIKLLNLINIYPVTVCVWIQDLMRD